jgi:signal transduction histidine kinase
VPVLASAAAVLHRDGGVDGAVVVFEDISKLKELQRLREEWASIVTHDLRQPLNVITMSVDMLRETAEKHDPQLLQKSLEQTEKASRTLNRMISDLADVSRIESRELKVQLQPVQLDSLTREVVERHRAAAPDRTITLQTDESMPQIEADPMRLEQVLDNLLGNAHKYADPGTDVQVEVRRDATEVRVLVSNRAPGIPAAEIPKVFDRFYRSGRARDSSKHGLGLGLYIAKALIDAHGGRIWAESQPGATTTFQFALPLERKAEAG